MTATLVLKKLLAIFHNFLAYSRKLVNRRSSEGLQNFKPSKGTNLLTLIILAGDIEMYTGSCVGYAVNTVKIPTNLLHVMTAKSDFMRHVQIPAKKELSDLKNENEPWYCSDCKADCGLCSGSVLNSHKTNVKCGSTINVSLVS